MPESKEFNRESDADVREVVTKTGPIGPMLIVIIVLVVLVVVAAVFWWLT